MRKILTILAAIAVIVSFTSCIRPYNTPKFAEIESNETAFLIPLFNDGGVTTEDQVKVDSEKYYQDHKVQDKMFRIPRRWVQKGRLPATGEYVDEVKVIKVSRTPISGTWEPDLKDKPSANPIKLETKESSGFQIPMAYNIKITEEDCAKYLYNYSPSKKLQEVIDTNINKWIVGKMNERFHALSYMEVSQKKDEIISEVVDMAIPYFKDRGITIESLTAYDGIYWDDQKIEESISRLVNAQAEQNAKEEELKAELKQAAIDKAKAEAKAEVEIINAKKDRDIANMKASTMNVERQKQEIENSRILAEAQAEALKIAAEKGNSVPGGQATTFIINSEALKAMGLDNMMTGKTN